MATKIDLLKAFREIDSHFKSGNEVPVERVTIRASQWNDFKEVVFSYLGLNNTPLCGRGVTCGECDFCKTHGVSKTVPCPEGYCFNSETCFEKCGHLYRFRNHSNPTFSDDSRDYYY